MKRIFLILFGLLFFAACTTLDSPEEAPAADYTGNYSGLSNYLNETTGRVHTAPVVIKIEEINGQSFVTTNEPNYPVDETGFGSGVQQTLDSTLVYSEKDSTGAREVIGIEYREIIKTETVQVVDQNLELSVAVEVFFTDQNGVVTENTIKGEGLLQKITQ